MSSLKTNRSWLKALRKNRGHSAPWIGRELGVTRDAVYQWESGSLNPTPANIFGLARLLGEEVIEKFRLEHSPSKEAN